VADRHILVIGGGIVGLSAAWYLVARGAAVTVVERDRIAASASAGNAGIVAVGHRPLPWPGRSRRALGWMLDRSSPLYIPPRLDLALLKWLWAFHQACRAERAAECMEIIGPLDRLSLRCWEEILAATGIGCRWERAGWLDIFASAAGRHQAEQEAAVSRRFGVRTEQLDGDALRERDPAFSTHVHGAVLYPESCILDPGRFLTGLVDQLRVAGVMIREETAVKQLIRRERRCIGAVLADGEAIEADTVVLAAGAWSTPLAHDAGVKLPMQAGKGYHLDLVAPVPAPRSGCVLVESSVAVTPMGDMLRLAGTLEFSGLNLHRHRRRVDMLRRAAGPYFQGVAEASEQEEWCGLRPCIADGLPVIDRAPYLDGLFLATGHAKMGLTHGPGTGKLIAEWLLDGEPSLDLSLLRADRF